MEKQKTGENSPGDALNLPLPWALSVSIVKISKQFESSEHN